ncbi:CLC_0170 family protein [Inediibacterium massiliense]|uniref:CLC_0170 family protein n=1 Tax=Inediibacterium massiliense TaxID=1658111 RepID=UPI0006B5C381|nr:CLC_0170 family protein [Inediibacterium massiliense]
MEKIILYFYEKLKDIYSLYLVFLVLGIGFFSLWIDSKNLKKKKLYREAKICKGVGLVYIIGGIGVYIVLKIV